LKFQLVDQLAATLGGGAEPVMLELGDQQLQLQHQRLGTGGSGLGLAPRHLLGRECGTQRVDIVWHAFRRGHHAGN
jgi:hypothetical protein